MFLATNAKPKTKQKTIRCFNFPKTRLLCILHWPSFLKISRRRIFAELPSLRAIKNTKQSHSSFAVLTSRTQAQTTNISYLLTCKRQLHKLLSTQEEHSLTNYFSIVFCFRQSEAPSIKSSFQMFPSQSFLSHNNLSYVQWLNLWLTGSHCQFSSAKAPLILECA